MDFSCWRHALIYDIMVRCLEQGLFQDTRTAPASTTKCIRTFWRDDLWAKVAELFFPKNMAANPTFTSWLKITRQETKDQIMPVQEGFSLSFLFSEWLSEFQYRISRNVLGMRALWSSKLQKCLINIIAHGCPWCLMFQKGDALHLNPYFGGELTSAMGHNRK